MGQRPGRRLLQEFGLVVSVKTGFAATTATWSVIGFCFGTDHQSEAYCWDSGDRRFGCHAGGRIRRNSSMPSADEIYEKVRDTLVDALGVDDDEVTPKATLIGDLGAESIDFLDIVFRLEKNFDIKIPRGELFPENLATADSGFVADGKVTADGISQLRTKMPHADIDDFAKDPAVSRISDLFTVEMICKFIAARLK
jgi:acyl carrier protein